MVDMNAIRNYDPVWPGVVELNLADQWRARWVNQQEFPENAPVNYAYALVLMGDKGYATREAGSQKWGMLEGEIGTATVEDFLKSALKERMGGAPAKVELIGFFECKPTRHNTAFQPGDVVLRPLYLIVAKTVNDLPDGSGYERRRFPLNEYLVALRARYPELLDYIGLATNRYGVLRAKGEA
ncbi:MAG: hypothetical protein ABI577_11910 [bacterium]